MFTCTVLEYVEGKWVCEGSGRQCAIGEETARKYMRDIVSGLTYLHAHVLSLNQSFCVNIDSCLSLRHTLTQCLLFSQSQLV